MQRGAGVIELPTAKGFIWDRELVIAPGGGGTKGWRNSNRAINEYKEQRNFPSNGTSQLSAALKFGAIGIRTVWAATIAALENSRSDEVETSIRAWQQELAWRSSINMQCITSQLATGAYRQVLKNFPYDNNEADFQAWCAGRTGYPIVDAAMRQMNEIGWMHNRCRMIVANFLTKTY